MPKRPNIIFILTDDHAAHAMSCYGSRINRTPQLDRIAAGGARLNNCFCTNSICTPSRAAILTGTYNHVNGATTLHTPLDNRIPTFPGLLREQGYQTAVYGKWHLGERAENCPNDAHFDDWAVLPGQGKYHNPEFIFKGPDGGTERVVPGYVTDLITDMSLDFIKGRDKEKPFCLLYHHKAPHREWESDEKHAAMYLDEDIPEPETLYDTYENRSSAAKNAKMRVGTHMNRTDLDCEIQDKLPEMELRKWAYQKYIKKYLRVVASIDDNVGRVLDYLDEEGIADDTIVIYTSDQGFFLGDHGWYDKRFMYEESLRMPFIMRYPRAIEPGTVNDSIVTNVDFAPTLLNLCGLEAPEDFQGRDFLPAIRGREPEDWPESMYYRYWMDGDHVHNTRAHYGIRTKRYKLICYYNDGFDLPGTSKPAEPLPIEWELFDLEKDPCEMKSVYSDPEYAETVKRLKAELYRKQAEVGDERYPGDTD